MTNQQTATADVEEFLDVETTRTTWPRVLCVDDDPEISGILEIRLRDFSIEVLRAYSGTHGYWLAVKHQPDAIITDLAMPQGRGDYLLESLKQNPRTAYIPVIVFTGRQNDGLFRRLVDNGAAAILSKPVDFQDILRVLSTHFKF